MSGINIASKSREEQNLIALDLIASGVAYRERLGLPVIAEAVARELAENEREYFFLRLTHYRKISEQMPGADASEYKSKAPDNEKNQSSL